MKRIVQLTAVFLFVTAIAAAQPSLPPTFKHQTITTSEGAQIYVRSGGAGPVVLLVHGFGDTGDMWGPLARELAKTRTVVVPDLRGMGLSSHPAGGYDKRTQAADLRSVLLALGHDRAAVVGHDIGNMVSYAYAARYPDKVERLVVMDAPIPGIDPWNEVIRDPRLWHFNFGGPDAERLVAGRERIFLDRFWNEFAANPSRIDEATRVHYAKLYARPGGMRSGFAQFAAFAKDAEDNKTTLLPKLAMPVLAVGGEKSFGALMAVNMRNAASDVTEAIVPDAGHWLMEENPAATIALIRDFLGAPQAASKKTSIVLVHGAFADGNAWSRVIPLLEREGYLVTAVQNPLTSFGDDVANTKRIVDAQSGTVVLVGHSYGGAVITAAASRNPKVKALVYVAAFGPEAGEKFGEALERFGPSSLGPALVADSGGYLSIDRAQFRAVFANDVPEAETRLMAATQKPIHGAIFGASLDDPAWKTIPAWYLVATQDRAITPDVERFTAKRMGATTIEVASSHVPFLTHPTSVAGLILQAAVATTK